MPEPNVGAGLGANRFSPTLFVEGKDQQAIDPRVLTELFRGLPVSVKPMGPSHHIQSAAEALHPHHPDYYFLIDRDHHDDTKVEASWSNFPDPDTNNLLIWRKRELENYFLDPAYLCMSQYCLKTETQVMKIITEMAGKRIYLDIVRAVIIELRETMKENWIELPQSLSGFETREKALARLLSMQEMKAKKKQVSRILDESDIEKKFHHYLNMYLDGTTSPQLGRGRWLDLIKGKKVLNDLSGKCFKVQDANGKWLDSTECVLEMAKDLLRKPLEDQPDDFRELHRLIEARVASV